MENVAKSNQNHLAGSASVNLLGSFFRVTKTSLTIFFMIELMIANTKPTTFN